MTKRLICRVGIILLVVVGIGALMLVSRILFAQDPSDTLPAPLLDGVLNDSFVLFDDGAEN